MNSSSLTFKSEPEKLRATEECNKEKALMETYPRIHILIDIINNL